MGIRVTVLMWICLVSSLLADETKVSQAIQRALPKFEEEGVWWIEEKKCVSCHHSSFFVWAKALADSRGFPVDKMTLSKHRDWVAAQFVIERKPNPKNPDDPYKPGQVNGDLNMEGVAQFLFSPASAYIPKEQRDRLKEIIVRNRLKDGSWKPGGQLPRQRRSKEETAAISAQWAGLAVGIDFKKPVTQVEGGAKSSEWYALAAVGGDESALADWVSKQNKDGGWSWIEGQGSGPTATGQTLCAIYHSGKQEEFAEAAARGRQWLLDNQGEDGLWETFSTKEDNKKTRVSKFWGSSWALIGLLEGME